MRPESQWRTWLMVALAIDNLGGAFFTVNFSPYMMAVTSDKERRHAFSVSQATTPAMAFIGSLIAGLLPLLFARLLGLTLDEPAPYRLALCVAPALLFAAIVPLLRADAVRITSDEKKQGDSGRAPVLWLAFFGVFVFLQVIGEGAVRSFFNVYLDVELQVSTAQIGTIMGVGQLLPIAAALSAPLLMARFGTAHALAVALLGAGLFLLPLASEPQLGFAAVAYIGVMATMNLATTTRSLFGQETVTPRWRTTAAAVSILGVALGWGMASLVGGQLIETLGFGTLFLFGAVTAIVAAGMLVAFLRWHAPDKRTSHTARTSGQNLV
jgi:MFS family permease